MNTPLETMKLFVLNRLGTMTNPSQIVKVFVLNRLDLVQEKTGVLHPRRYGLGNVIVGWMQDRGWIAIWVREDCGPQYHLPGAPWMLYDVYDYFVTPTGWGLYRHNAKVILKALYPIIKPLGMKIYYIITMYMIWWVFYHHFYVAFLYWLTGRPNPRRYTGICTTPGGTAGLITRATLREARQFRRKQLLEEFRVELSKWRQLRKEHSDMQKFEYKYFRVATFELASRVLTPSLRNVHNSVHIRLYKLLGEIPENVPLLSFKEMSADRDAWEANTNTIPAFFDPCCLMLILPQPSEMSFQFKKETRVLIHKSIFRVLQAQSLGDKKKIFLAQQQFKTVLQLREG